MAGWADEIKEWADDTLKWVDKRCYSMSWQLFTYTVRYTPSPSNPGATALGVLSNQWYPLIGNSYSTQKGSDKSPTGASSLQRITALANKNTFYRKDGAMTMANNMHYAYRAEYVGWPMSDGWSGRVGPYRMVARAMQEVMARN